jgi:hypothetical protein
VLGKALMLILFSLFTPYRVDPKPVIGSDTYKTPRIIVWFQGLQLQFL